MLIKKELENIPVLAYPKMTKGERKGYPCVATAMIHVLEKGGNVLVVDIFDEATKALKLRFFSDKNTYLVCNSWPPNEWFKKKPDNLLTNGIYNNVASIKKEEEIAKEFFEGALSPWRNYRNLDDYINEFARAVYAEKQSLAMQRKYAKKDEHFAMYPDYPIDLSAYCDRHVFGFTYIFIDKTKDGKRTAICGHCKKKYKAKSTEAKPGKPGVCPKCGMMARYRGDWAAAPMDKARICIAHKADGQLLLRWADVERTYYETKLQYRFNDYYRNLYLHTAKGDTIYAYKMMCVMYHGWGWYRKNNGTVNYERTHVYTGNLNEVFGNTYHHVNLQDGLANAGQLKFPRLLDNLKTAPATEYIFKMGLSVLASDLHNEDLQKGGGFVEVLGVSRQYLPLYRQFNVGIHEHRVIKASRTWVSVESFEKFRALKPDTKYTKDIIDVLDGMMSFERFVNYFTRQQAILKSKLNILLTQYKDYISMAESLRVDLTRKSVRYPKNIKVSHDLILARYNEVKYEVEDENFKQAIEKLYNGMSEYSKGDFCIVFPRLRSELITEGQSLNHCVGAESYYKNHAEGIRMIFFLRKIKEPEKAFFTMEIDMRELGIRQLYGFGGSSAPTEVRQFANDFLRRLKLRSYDQAVGL